MPPRNRILLEQRQRIIQAFEDVSEDYLTVAATIGVNRSTARSIVARYLREGRIAERPRGEANHVRVDDEMRNCLNDIINEYCLLTLGHKSRVEAASPTKTGNPWPHSSKITWRYVVLCKIGGHSQLIGTALMSCKKRVDYTNWFMRNAVVNHSIFGDECGYTPFADHLG